MGLTSVLVLAGGIFLVGFIAGVRFEELNLRARERRLARERRDIRQAADALHVYDEMNRALVRAGSRLRAQAVRDDALLAVADALDEPPARSAA